jgi:hypothetical protein
MTTVLAEGNCLADREESPATEVVDAAQLEVVERSEPHEHEVYAADVEVDGAIAGAELVSFCPDPRSFSGWRASRDAQTFFRFFVEPIVVRDGSGGVGELACSFVVAGSRPGERVAITESLRDAMNAPLAIADYGACPSQFPDTAGPPYTPPFTPCDSGAWVPGAALVDWSTDGYPGPQELERVGTERCSAFALRLTGSTDPTTYQVRTPSESRWADGHQVIHCYVLVDAVQGG